MSKTTPAPITPTPDVPCPDSDLGDKGWVLFEDHCYRVFSSVEVQIKDWYDARSQCQSFGGELLSVLSLQENSFILSKVQILESAVSFRYHTFNSISM